MRGFPTREEWDAAIAAGFRSNGCSNSPDLLVLSGLRIANEDHDAYPPAPCDLHDYRYWFGGDEIERAQADCELYIGIFMLVDAARERNPVMGQVWAEQARLYWNAVRLAGESHFTKRGAMA